MSQPAEPSKTAMQKVLDVVEKVGNKVPHPVLIFLILIVFVLVLSHILFLAGASVSYQVIDPETHKVEDGDDGGPELADGERDSATCIPG